MLRITLFCQENLEVETFGTSKSDFLSLGLQTNEKL